MLTTVQKNVHCPQCGKSYAFSKIKIRGIIDSIVFLELHCKNHMPLLATVALVVNPIKQIIGTKEKINSDDILETHNFLEHFSGSFEQIFAPRRRQSHHKSKTGSEGEPKEARNKNDRL